ncbi:hypothetical protein HPB51_000186 [Rhipicephalus microplus]|uniref:Uncharacterized protein n=1 Tax=Rhipicephalus microplus TaxID=6941 RepID=A0A9J6D3H4_RHIMP|nr:hypothetical protein HPB51_000186 [Rhipicephalus microplus]
MPTHAELAKRLEELEEKLKTEASVESVFARILLKLNHSGFDAVQMKKKVDDLVVSAKFTEKIVEELRQDNAALMAKKKSLNSENRMMSRKLAEIEQYSRLNNVEIRGVPCTQGEDCVAILQTPAHALQPCYDPPLPPFPTSCIESWFQEFDAALELNGIWLQEFMFEVLDYHLPCDLKCHLTYFARSSFLYDLLPDAMLQ